MKRVLVTKHKYSSERIKLRLCFILSWTCVVNIVVSSYFLNLTAVTELYFNKGTHKTVSV